MHARGQRGTTWHPLQVPPYLLPAARRLKGTSGSLPPRHLSFSQMVAHLLPEV